MDMIPNHNSPKNWTEDYQHENGKYICHCVICDEYFFGYKRRVVCKECATLSHPTLPSDEVEFALKLNKYIHDQCIDGTPHDIGWNVMKMFSTRIAEMERELKDTKRLLQQHIDFRAECTALNDPAITEIDEKHFPF